MKKSNPAVPTVEFVEALTNAEGILVLSDEHIDDGEYAVQWCNQYFDTATTICNNTLLCLANDRDVKVIDGKNVSTIYSLGSCYINLESITNIIKLDEEQKADLFELTTDQAFEITLFDKVCCASQKLCVGFFTKNNKNTEEK